MPAPLLQLHAIEKSFAGVRALKPINLTLAPGEVLGLIGENGAGKSTLIRILSGVHASDAGRIEWQRRNVVFGSPHDALVAGIATIHQELAYFGHLTVAENLLLGEHWPRHLWGGIDWPRLHAEAAARLARFQLSIPTDRVFSQLSAAQKQEIAITRALDRRAQLLILDEPTASLTEPEVRRLFTHLARLRAEGVALIYVSHRLDEILQLTDRVAVLRDGELITAYPTREATVERMVHDMVGRALPAEAVRSMAAQDVDTRPLAGKEPLLELQSLSRNGMFHDINLSVRPGEIVGLAGLVGAGRSELARAIYGLYPPDKGAMRLAGQPWTPRHPSDALAAGLAYLPEERKRQSLVLDHSVSDSISIGFTDLLSRWGMIYRQGEEVRVSSAMKRCDVRATDPAQSIGTLSGGNQQKAVLARWLERAPRVLLLDEPTRGVDVGAKAEIHQLIRQLAETGRAVLLISSDLPEVLGLSHRVFVMHRSGIAAELRGENLTQQNVLMAASGLASTSPTPPAP